MRKVKIPDVDKCVKRGVNTEQFSAFVAKLAVTRSVLMHENAVFVVILLLKNNRKTIFFCVCC